MFSIKKRQVNQQGRVKYAANAHLKSKLQRRSLHLTRSANLLRKVVQQGVETFKTALVDGHPDPPELAVAASVEGDPLGRGGRGHTGATRIEERGCGIFRRGSGVPRPHLDRLQALISRAPAE